jgi:hypothetical protein
MRISASQMAAFDQASTAAFVSNMVGHLSSFAPRHCEVIGEPFVRETIQRGFADCERHGLTKRGPVQLYLELMLLFGSGFASDPQLEWASHALADGDPESQMARAHALHAACLEYLEAAAGPGHCYTLEALAKLRDRQLDRLSFGPPRLREGLLDEMLAIYPQKCHAVGRTALGRLIDEAAAVAQAQGLWSFDGVVLVCVLMFALGHEFAADPLYPWVRVTLSDPRLQDTHARVRKLEGRALAYLDRVLAHFALHRSRHV